MSSKQTASVVLVHGAWADGSSWQRVIGRLLAQGVAVIAVQNPTTSLADDAAATLRILDKVAGPAVLVGHSWGGTVITEAGNHPNVKALVYVAAFAPEPGQSTGDQVGAHPPPPGLSGVSEDKAGRLWMSVESWISNVAQDLPEAEARLLAAVQTPLGLATFSDKVSKAPKAETPVWYIISRRDRAVSVELQDTLAKRLKARTTALETSHMSLLSAPDAVTNVILQAVEAVTQA
ncbi:pimeloyl-ACP methyl ester carboxylesterase [Rhizomicrobium palustre]|uniref:Pimeloyl-ACP methyl ester carboxylesterase n=1 Tax=Rhizomicrobium palustre TaxID=189966 RepID=A0A846MYE7_9PROT|nr:alpha/beta hydrolase [Rhizomicrobium palustre]NIK88020.1 pimeloyl-ACP methyl ester carboxylesterase [Rhizomicrobium palustre]